MWLNSPINLSVCSSLEHLQQPAYVVTKDITCQHLHYVKETWRGEKVKSLLRINSAVVNGFCFDVIPTHIPCPPGAAIAKHPCNSPHLTTMPPSSYLREVRGLKGEIPHWPNWRWIRTQLTLQLPPWIKIVQQHQMGMGMNFFPYLCCVYVCQASQYDNSRRWGVLFISPHKGELGSELICALSTLGRVRGQDHFWDSPISSWDLGYKLMFS